MSEKLVNFEVRDGVIYATLDNYARRNALSNDLLEQLAVGAREHMVRDGAHVLVLSGDGGIFSSGVDVTTVKASAAGDVAATYLNNGDFGRYMNAFASLPIAKIALIDGFCFGAGIILASHCDVRFASERAVFCLPELDLGAPFSGGGMDRLAYHFGHTKAVDLVLTARRFPATEALDAGFLTEMMSHDALARRGAEYAAMLAARPPFLVMQTVLSGHAAYAAAVRPPSAEFDGAMLAAYDERARAQNHVFASRFGKSGK